jgi:uncharacterized protein (TIGR02145 family)
LGAVYGKLYNHAAVVDPRGLAPVGWHIPADSFHVSHDVMGYADGDWTKMLRFLGSQFYTVPQWIYQAYGTQILYNGAPEVIPQMKAPTLWNNNSTQPNNQSGFTGLPGGQRNADGSFSAIGDIGRWWSSGRFTRYVGSFDGNEDYYYVSLSIDANNLHVAAEMYSTYYFGPVLAPGHDIPYYVYYPAGFGFSVRCVKD